MALARTRRGDSGMNYWPGFVDALSTLILSIIFILTVFVVVQFYFQQEVAGKDTALTRLNAQIAELTSLLSLEKAGKSDLESQLAALRATLASTESERDKLKSAADSSGSNAAAAQGQPMPMPERAVRQGDGVRVSFTGLSDGLHAWSGPPLGVELCGETQESCRYAVARVDGDALVIAGDGLPATRVRYAWADAPVVNLFDARPLPVPGFELEIR